MSSTTASLSFETTSQPVVLGQNVDLNVNIFTDQEAVISTDIWIQYNPELLQPILPAKGSNLFESTEAKILEPGRIYIYGLRRDTLTAGPANGKIATLTFKALKNGNASFAFICNERGSVQSQIIKNDPQLENIINCERTTSHTATIVVGESQVLGASDKAAFPFNMWYLTALVAVLTFTMILYIRTKKLAKEEI